MTSRVEALARRLPEPVLHRLVLIRNSETQLQSEAKHRLRDLRRSPESIPAGYCTLDKFPTTVLAREVEAFDAHTTLAENVALVSKALDRAHVRHVLVPTGVRGEVRVAVSSDDRQAALTALATYLGGAEWCVAKQDTGDDHRWTRRLVGPATSAPQRVDAKVEGIRVFRLLSSSEGHVVAGPELACHLDFWTPVTSARIPRPDGGNFAVGTMVAPFAKAQIVAYLSPKTWQAAATSATHEVITATRRTLFEVREPVDIVYTWVDGEDPAWLTRKAAYDTSVPADAVNSSANHQSRFQSRDELRYSLRSVAEYASWARRIYLVTDRQVPAWLDTDHPHIRVVDHSEIFSDPSVLPVFNSHAIESQLHHIPGLSEHFLYLNDDVFFGRVVSPDLFFHGNGMGKFFLSKATLDLDPPSSADLPVMSAAKHNRELIEQEFGATVINKFKHTPHPQLKSVLDEIESKHPDMVERVSASRFRHPDDLSITSALHHYYAYATGRSIPGTIRYMYQDIARPDTARRLTNLLRDRNYDVFCLNDHETSPDSFATQRAMLTEFFQRYFPVASPYERID